MGSFFTIASRSAGPILAAHPEPRTDSVRRKFFFGLLISQPDIVHILYTIGIHKRIYTSTDFYGSMFESKCNGECRRIFFLDFDIYVVTNLHELILSMLFTARYGKN